MKLSLCRLRRAAALSMGFGCATFTGSAAFAFEKEVQTGLYYFTSDAEKRAQAETEVSEGGLRFRAERDLRDAARERAEIEIQRGNVCLVQAGRDLQAARKERRLRALCDEIFGEDLRASLEKAEREKFHADYFRCSAVAEAHEDNGKMRVVLGFRGELFLKERLPPRLRRAEFPLETMSWEFAPQEQASAPQSGWKEALKAGVCGYDKEALEKFLEHYRQTKRDARALARCRHHRVRDGEWLTRLQKQLKEYVPEEWVKEAARGGERSLFTAPVPLDPYGGLKECREARAKTREQLKALQKVSEKIADRHDVPALDPANQEGRAPASEDEDE